MEAVGITGQRNVQIIVHDKGNMVVLAEGLYFLGGAQKFVKGQVLFPQLYTGHAAGQGFFYRCGQGGAIEPAAVGDGVEL